MSSDMDRHLSPAETAKRFGITIKALRLYEQRGLLTPRRTSNGSTGSAWRAYGPEEIARLHQIQALKRLGLPLARIGALLKGRDAVEPVLALQEQVLARDGERLAHALRLIRAARTKLAAGYVLSIDDLATIAQETVLNSKASIADIKDAFAPIAARHFTQEEKERFFAGKNAQQSEMLAIRGLVEKAMETGDPACAPAREAAERYRNVGHAIAGGDPALLAKIRAFRQDAQNDPKLSEWMFLSPRMQAFIDQALTHLA
jgi:DNA-binding transcriptional MerR regulator